MISFVDDTITMIISGSILDYLDIAMDVNYLTKIK